jgi:type II secretory pathway pseudopilin PulG
MRGMRRAIAFTLTELMIVIGIIVLFVTLALPAFNLISGSRSVAGAENEIGALLGRARMEAVGVQDYRGLAIYRDAATDRYTGAIVSAVTYSAFPTQTPTPFYGQYSYVTYGGHNYVALSDIPANSTTGTAPPPNAPPSALWSQCDSIAGSRTLDVTADSDVQAFPTGVGVQVINNCTMTGNPPVRQSNGYLPIGVVLFNGQGQLAPLQTISFAVHGHLGTIGTFSGYSLQSGQSTIPYYNSTGAVGLPLTSALGLVGFDKQTFDSQNFYSTLTPQFPSQLTSMSTPTTGNSAYSTSTGDGTADAWLDANSTPLLINRYNGTLVRSE